jgi:hypothetical protein
MLPVNIAAPVPAPISRTSTSTYDPNSIILMLPATPAPDPVELLTHVADADRLFAKVNNGTYALSVLDLLNARCLFELEPKRTRVLQVQLENIPSVDPLPSDLIVGYLYDNDSRGCTLLMGDWTARHVSEADLSAARARSESAKQSIPNR